MEQLTKKEEELMQVFWKLGRGTVRDAIDNLQDDRKPPHSTVSSVARILAKKGFLGFKAYGKTYEYYPLVSKEEYGKFSFRKMLTGYFDNSYKHLASFIGGEDLSSEEIKALKSMIDNLPDDK
ncbi:transcriptional regulator (plasmid) [Fulvitalea axinellae]|uniref:Transcriptional regulator n=1 Tax=Fulvitalea axinellae TaxID=1182444 RepID=A0AAU9DN25_9BACT|nr:transcriptional regulator [Fulvitalea axinellae]